MMNDICKRLNGSLRYDAINGNVHERAIVAGQIREAVARIQQLEAENADLRKPTARRDCSTCRSIVGCEDARGGGVEGWPCWKPKAAEAGKERS